MIRKFPTFNANHFQNVWISQDLKTWLISRQLFCWNSHLPSCLGVIQKPHSSFLGIFDSPSLQCECLHSFFGSIFEMLKKPKSSWEPHGFWMPLSCCWLHNTHLHWQLQQQPACDRVLTKCLMDTAFGFEKKKEIQYIPTDSILEP